LAIRKAAQARVLQSLRKSSLNHFFGHVATKFCGVGILIFLKIIDYTTSLEKGSNFVIGRLRKSFNISQMLIGKIKKTCIVYRAELLIGRFRKFL
jgi:hypothetical protein